MCADLGDWQVSTSWRDLVFDATAVRWWLWLALAATLVFAGCGAAL